MIKDIMILLSILLLLFIFSFNFAPAFSNIKYNSPKIDKLSQYECGEEPFIDNKEYKELHIKYYLIALTYLLFDIEIVLLFPFVSFIFPNYDIPFYNSFFILIFIFFLLFGLLLEYLYGLFY